MGNSLLGYMAESVEEVRHAWYEETVMSQRREFIGLAGVSMKVSVACRGFGISRKTGYEWLDRLKREERKG